MTINIKVKNLNKSYRSNFYERNTVVLDDVSFSVDSGECTGIIGHNGAGKTTTLKILLGLIKAQSGSILLNGKKITRDDRRNIGYMPESDRLPMRLTCLEVLYLQMSLMSIKNKNSKQFCYQMLANVGLKGSEKKLVSNLSKGMRRRLAWASANLSDPDLLVLDEPFSGLDPVGRNDLVNWIEALKKKNKTIILCTHELWSISKLCSRLVILKNGKIVYKTDESNKDANKYSFSAPFVDEKSNNIISEILDQYELKYKEVSNNEYVCSLNNYNDFIEISKKLSSQSIEINNFTKNYILSEQEAIKYF